MKTYELNQQANQLSANNAVENKTFLDFYNDVKTEKIVPITDQNENIIGFNVVKPKPSTMKVCKMVDGKMTVGDTEADRAEDEVAMRKFMEEYAERPVQKWFEDSLVLIKAGVQVDDIIDLDGDTYVIDATRKVVMDLTGGIVEDLSQDPDLEGASKKIIIKLLKAAVNANF